MIKNNVLIALLVIALLVTGCSVLPAAASVGPAAPAVSNAGQGKAGSQAYASASQNPLTPAASVAARGNPNRGGGQTPGQGAGGQAQTTQKLSTPAGSLSQAEIEGLLWMREEEKLARDVYNALYATWGLPVFQSIAQSEQTHMDAVKGLLDRYGLADPAAAEPGVFTNPELQALYDRLMAQGRESVVAALQVGAAIEEIDILDLQEQLTLVTAADVQQVYTNLLRASENHLRAFVNNLSAQGVSYSPQYLSPEAYQAILSGTSGYRRGNQGNAGRNGRP